MVVTAEPSPFIVSTQLSEGRHHGVEYEIQQIRMPRWATRGQVRRLLTDQAEYGGWELWRLRRYPDGSREAWLRRTIIRARLTARIA